MCFLNTQIGYKIYVMIVKRTQNIYLHYNENQENEGVKSSED